MEDTQPDRVSPLVDGAEVVHIESDLDRKDREAEGQGPRRSSLLQRLNTCSKTCSPGGTSYLSVKMTTSESSSDGKKYGPHPERANTTSSVDESSSSELTNQNDGFHVPVEQGDSARGTQTSRSGTGNDEAKAFEAKQGTEQRLGREKICTRSIRGKPGICNVDWRSKFNRFPKDKKGRREGLQKKIASSHLLFLFETRKMSNTTDVATVKILRSDGLRIRVQ